jgi:hypothetical protein
LARYKFLNLKKFEFLKFVFYKNPRPWLGKMHGNNISAGDRITQKNGAALGRASLKEWPTKTHTQSQLKKKFDQINSCWSIS